MKEFEARWIGWAGVNVPDEVGQKALTKALAEKVCNFELTTFTMSIFCCWYLLDDIEVFLCLFNSISFFI